jgi:uncharacterized protein
VVDEALLQGTPGFGRPLHLFWQIADSSFAEAAPRRKFFDRQALRLALLLLTLHPLAAWPEQTAVPIQSESPRVQSMRALRDAGVVRQKYDYSCGSAALATLLTYGLGDPTDEDAILRVILSPLSGDELLALQKRGLSLLDLQKIAQGRGHKAQGFRIAASQLSKLSRPLIVFIKPGGYEHFAVFKGLRGGRAHLADPSLGNVRMPLYRFLDMWADATGHGIVFAVERKDGSWPAASALTLKDADAVQLEWLSAQRLIDIGGRHPLNFLPN